MRQQHALTNNIHAGGARACKICARRHSARSASIVAGSGRRLPRTWTPPPNSKPTSETMECSLLRMRSCVQHDGALEFMDALLLIELTLCVV